MEKKQQRANYYSFDQYLQGLNKLGMNLYVARFIIRVYKACMTRGGTSAF